VGGGSGGCVWMTGRRGPCCHAQLNGLPGGPCLNHPPRAASTRPVRPPPHTSPLSPGTTCPWLCAGCVCAYARLVPFGAGDERGRGGGLGTGACVRAAGLPHPEVPRSVVLWLPCWVPSCQSHQLGRGCGGCRLMTRAPGSCMGRRGSGVGGQRVCATGAARRHCCRAPVLFLSSAARHLPGGKRFCLVHVCPWVSCTVSCTVS
jgi:hypothetical protein